MTMNKKTHRASGGLRISFLLGGMLSLFVVGAAGAVMAVAIEPADSSRAATQGKTYGHVYRVGKDVIAPIPTYMGDAEFPRAALASKEKFEGVCLIGLVVDSSGEPRDVHVVHSLRPDFDANAIKAVQQYHFIPAKRLGTPVAVTVNVEVNFRRY